MGNLPGGLIGYGMQELSTFILLIQYIHLLALKTSLTRQIADQIISILSIIGAINIPIIKFSVNWWNTLLKPNITTSGSSIDSEMLYALPLMLIAFMFISLSIFLRNIQFEILLRAPSKRNLGDHDSLELVFICYAITLLAMSIMMSGTLLIS